MPKLISPDPPSFNPSSMSSFSTSSSKRLIRIKKPVEFDTSTANRSSNSERKRLNANAPSNDLTLEKGSIPFRLKNSSKDSKFYSSLSSSSYSSMSSCMNLAMSSTSNSSMSSSMYSCFNDHHNHMHNNYEHHSVISKEESKYNKYVKMVDRKLVGVLPKLNDSLRQKSMTKLESINEIIASKKNGWKIKEKYKKSRRTPLKCDEIIQLNHPSLVDNFKLFSYASLSSNSPVSTSSSSSFLSISDVVAAAAVSQRPTPNQIKSVALSYYHHLHDQKQKSFNSNNSSVQQQQPLYKFTYKDNGNSLSSNTSKTAKLSNYESFKYGGGGGNNSVFCPDDEDSLINSLLAKSNPTHLGRIRKESPILNDQSLLRLEKNLPDCLTGARHALKFDRLTKSTNNIDNDTGTSANLKIISKLNRNEFLEDKLNVKTVYKNVSSNKRKNFSEPHGSLIRDTLNKLDDTVKKDWLTSTPRSSLTQTSQLEINVCNVNSKSQAAKETGFSSPYQPSRPNYLNKPLQLSINTKKSLGGLLTADIKLNDQAINFDLNKIDDTKYEIKLLPTKTGTYQVHVYLNGQSVSGSPFLIKIDSLSNGEANKALRSKETLSMVDLKKYDVITSTPNPTPPPPVTPPPVSFKLMVRAELTDDEIFLNVGKEIKLNIIAIDAVKKEKLVAAIVGIQSKVVYNNFEMVKHDLEKDTEANYQLKFMPTKEGIYCIKFYKDGQFIEGSSLELIVKEKTISLTEKRPMYTQVGVPFIMTVDHKNVENLKVKVNMKQNDNTFLTSSSSELSVSSHSTQFSPLLFFMSSLRVEKIIENKNRLRIKFVPVEPVEHIIDITENGKSLENYPIKLNVFPNKDVLMINENLNGVKIGAAAKLALRLNDQKSSLNIRITHLEENSPHYVSFLLTEEYMEIQHIFAALCKFLRLNSNRLKDGECKNENGQTRVTLLLVDDIDQNSNIFLLKELKAIIDNDKYVIIDLSIHKTIKAVKDSLRFGPKNENVRFKLEKKSDELYSLEFKPNLIGKYRVDIENFNKPILNSPCFVDAFDPNQVVITKPSDSFLVGTENFIDVDLTKAGLSKFKVWIETPTGSNQPIIFDANYSKKVGIIPKEIGKYLVFMKLGDSLVKGVPFEITAVKPEVPVVHGHGLYRAIENQKAVFNIIAPKNFDSDLNIKIKSPSQKYIGFTITKLSENDYQITYFPSECGKYIISIVWSDKELPESVYEVCVFNPAKIKVLNQKNESIRSQVLGLEMNEENLFVFDTKDAGSGILNVEIMSLNYEKVPYSRIVKDKIHKIFFIPPTEGEYKINALWNSFPVTKSPIVARTLDFSSILREVKLVNDNESFISKPKLNEATEFVIDCSKAKKIIDIQPQVSIISAADDQESVNVKVTKVSQGIYKCSYLLDRPDDYLMSVKLNGMHISNSPFMFSVCVETDSTKVKFNKEDIKLGIVGQEIKTLIDTSQAGPGELTANCMGTHVAAVCKFEDKKNGIYLLTIIPQETGKHVLQIKYNDEHIPDSPFNIRVSNQPDASKVKVFGPGIYHGVLSDFKSKFSCDTKGAGAGQLTVRIKGPKGAFKVEMQRESEKDRKITCKYDPIEAGDYQINVKWSGKHVPNSPFNVKIFKKLEDLETYLKENPNEKKREISDDKNQNE